MSAARKIWRVSWKAAVCLLLLGWIFQAIFYDEGSRSYRATGGDWEALTRGERLKVAWAYGPQGVWDTLTVMNPLALALSVGLMGVNILVGILRWQIILKVHGLALPFKRTAEISLVAHFFNSFLLGSVGGDLLKAYYVARETRHKKTEAVVTVAVDRILGLFGMLVFGCLLIIPNHDLLFSTHKLEVVVWTILAMTAGCAAFLLVAFRGGLSKRMPTARAWLRRMPKGELLESVLEAFREFGRNRGFFLRILPVVALGNVVIICHFLALMWGFNLRLPVLEISAVVPMVTSISSLPITPSGLGVRENLYVWMLGAKGIGIPAAEALLVSIIGFGTSLVWSVVGGIVYLTVRDQEHLGEITTQSKVE